MPPATGIRLAIVTATPPSPPGRAGAARGAARERLAQGPDRAEGEVVGVLRDQPAPSPVTATLSASAGVTVTSSNRDTAWNTVTRPW